MKHANNDSAVRQVFPVLEMSCAACAVSVESSLKATPGVIDAAVNFANQTASVVYHEDVVKPLQLQQAVRAIGYDLVVEVEDPQAVKDAAEQKKYLELRNRTLLSGLLAIPVVLIGMFWMDMPFGSYISLLLSGTVVFYFGRSFFINAWKQASHGKANMDSLVALSTGIAFLFSAFNTFFPQFWHRHGLHAHVYYEAAVVVIVFISLGKLLEERAKSSTSSAIKKLMGMQAKQVTILSDGIEKVIPVKDLHPGHQVVVKPGERIPVDGTVVSGASYVEESMISGEPMPVEKKSGAKVFAGTLNQKGSFVFNAEKIGAATLLGQIISMVQLAQGSKAPVQNLVDKVAGIFVPVVIALSLITFSIWMLVGGDQSFTHALLTSVTVLVIACPCALGLATPTAIMVGIGKGANNQMLIKDAESLELAHRVNTIVLDKTGTITEGKPEVTDHEWDASLNSGLLSVLYTLEQRSEHPLAEALVRDLSKENLSRVHLDQFDSITGRGIKGSFQGRMYFVGSFTWMDEMKLSVPPALSQAARRWSEQAKTIICFADDIQVLAVYGIADRIKASSPHAIEALVKMGKEIHLVTGDAEPSARSVARQAGIANIQAGMLPGDKAKFIQQLQQQGKVVAMVGDGINDSQALAQADVSIAMGKGSDIAIDVAKITLITSDLSVLPKVLKLSSKTVRTVRENLFWAFIYNIIGIPVAAGILYPINGFLLNPMLASAAMALSSLSVVMNSLRLKASAL
jgi:Cu2+-exporting ATPase